MRRRTLLLGVAGATGLSGCVGGLDGSDGDEPSSDGSNRTPAMTVEAFYDAALSGDADAARSYFHPSSELPPPPNAAIREVANGTLRLGNATVVERSDATATVSVTVSQEHPRTGNRITNTISYELRPSEGEWLIYAQPLPEPEPTAPNVTWEIESRSNGAGEVTAVAITHAAGDALAVGNLAIEVGGATMGPGSESGDLVAGDVVRVPFETDGSPVAAGETVEIVWTADGATPIGNYDLETATTGQPASTFEVDA